MHNGNDLVAPGRIAAFFLLAFGLTWLCWLPAALSPAGATTDNGRLLLYAGGAGPLLATLMMLWPASQREIRARWWRRLGNIRGLLSPAGALCVVLPILIVQLALDTFAIAGGIRLPGPRAGELMALLLPTLLLGPLPEELAWRGYALPALLRRCDPLLATLLLATAWGLWHLPLFFMKGTYHAGIELASLPGLLFFVNIASQSLLMTTLYLATRCTWAAVLFHWLTNLAGEAWQLPLMAELHRTLWTLLLACLVVLLKPPFGIREGGSEAR